MSDVELPGLLPPTGPIRRSRRAQEKRRRRRKRRSLVAILISLAILGGAGAAIWFGAKPLIVSLTAPSDYPGPGTGSVLVRIPDGASGRTIGRLLAEKQVVKSANAFVDAANQDVRAQRIRPGTYELRTQMTSAGALAVLVDPKNRQVKTFTVAEGKRVAEIVDIIAKAGIPKRDLQVALKDPAALGVPEWATSKKGLKFPTEGFLFPKTYELEPGDTAVSVLSAMVKETLDALDVAGVPENQRWKVLTEASILQAEGGQSSDYPKMARVLDNRTKEGWKFQLDSTTSYAVQRFGVTTTAKERDTPSPYNTYYVKGYPLGPICNPGAETIAAALSPAKGTWMYWVTVNPDTGETKFATTDAEAQKNVAEFQKWLRDNPKGT